MKLAVCLDGATRWIQLQVKKLKPGQQQKKYICRYELDAGQGWTVDSEYTCYTPSHSSLSGSVCYGDEFAHYLAITLQICTPRRYVTTINSYSPTKPGCIPSKCCDGKHICSLNCWAYYGMCYN